MALAGWREALEAECAASAQLRRYATDPREGDCLRLLPGIRPGRALFFGNALAIVPFLMAGHFESVVVAEANARRIDIARRRQQAEDAANVTCVAAASPGEAARGQDPFDLVVLGEEEPDAPRSMPVADRAAAARVASVMARGGALLYGLRLSRTSLRGRYPAHRRLLERAGFTFIRGYARQPAQRPYQVHLPLDRPEIVSYWIRSRRQSQGLRPRATAAARDAAIRLRMHAFLYENFLVVARRG